MTMRLWSICFEWLDPIGLVALWRESSLAKAVLYGFTKGYTKHPQLFRFKSYSKPLQAINTYLFYIQQEADYRGYSFSNSKIDNTLVDKSLRLKVSQGQLDYELLLLRSKLRTRSITMYDKIKVIERGKPNELFITYEGIIEPWEKRKNIQLN